MYITLQSCQLNIYKSLDNSRLLWREEEILSNWLSNIEMNGSPAVDRISSLSLRTPNLPWWRKTRCVIAGTIKRRLLAAIGGKKEWIDTRCYLSFARKLRQGKESDTLGGLRWRRKFHLAKNLSRRTGMLKIEDDTHQRIWQRSDTRTGDAKY